MKQSTLLDLADSDSDSGYSVRTSMPKTTENMAATKKPRGRPPTNRVTKTETKAATRRAGAKKAAAVEKELERKALADKPANQKPKAAKERKATKIPEEEQEQEEDEDEDEDEGEEDEDVLATPPGSDEPARAAKGGRRRPRKGSVIPESAQKLDDRAAAKKAARKAAKAEQAAPQQDSPSEVPETQVHDLMDVDGEEQDQVEDLPMFSRFSAPPSTQRVNSHHIPLSASKRPSSSSSRESDPDVRRRLGEMTKKYETLEFKYRDLRNVAVTEAEKTFDRLKQTSEDRAQSTSNRRAVVGRQTQTDVLTILT